MLIARKTLSPIRPVVSSVAPLRVRQTTWLLLCISPHVTTLSSLRDHTVFTWLYLQREISIFIHGNLSCFTYCPIQVEGTFPSLPIQLIAVMIILFDLTIIKLFFDRETEIGESEYFYFRLPICYSYTYTILMATSLCVERNKASKK